MTSGDTNPWLSLTFVTPLAKGSSLTATLPAETLRVTGSGRVDPSAFLSDTVDFAAEAGTVTCIRESTTVTCTLANVVLRGAYAGSTCSITLPATTIHAAVPN